MSVFSTRFRAMGLWLAVVALCCAAAAATAADRKPNILLIVADDLGYADLGFQGGSDIPTPSLDALASRGVRFSNGYVVPDTDPFENRTPRDARASRLGLRRPDPPRKPRHA